MKIITKNGKFRLLSKFNNLKLKKVLILLSVFLPLLSSYNSIMQNYDVAKIKGKLKVITDQNFDYTEIIVP